MGSLRSALRKLGASWVEHPALILLCLALVAAGCVLRMHDLAFPESFGFDEDHFVRGARAYLGGREDRNDHPPLGKLLIALSMWLQGDDSVAWRTAPLVVVLTMVWAAMISPWVLSTRDSYIPHYLPSHTVGLILVAGVVAHAYERFRYAALSFLALVTVVSAWYAPVWAQLEISPDALVMRLPLVSWR